MNQEWPQMPDKPYEKGGPGDHHPDERSISGRACLPLLIMMVGLPLVVVLAIVGVVRADAVSPSSIPWNRTTVHVQSELGAGWPVQLAVEAWDDSSALDVVYSGTTCASTSCIKIVWNDDLPANVLGEASVAKDALGRYKSCTIKINADIVPELFSEYRRLSLIRHEAGHCFGFAHSTTGLDVMYQYIRDGGPQNLSEFHRGRLLEVYPYGA